MNRESRCNSLFISDVHKQHSIVSFRRRSASHNYSALCMLRDTDWSPVTSEHCTQLAFDQFCIIIHNILDIVYPMRSVTITSRDLPFVTPNIKYLLSQRNYLLHAGHQEQAAAMSSKIAGLQLQRSMLVDCPGSISLVGRVVSVLIWVWRGS